METKGSSSSGSDQQCTSCGGSGVKGWCVECVDALCAECLEAHRRVKMTRSHTIQDRPAAGFPGPGSVPISKFCPTHHREPLQIYCFSCNLLTCRDCQLMDHRNHNFQFVREALQSLRGMIECLVQPLSSHRECARQSILAMSARLQVISEHKVKLRAILQQFLTHFYKRFKQRLMQLHDETMVIYKAEEEDIQRRILDLTKMTEQQVLLAECSDVAKKTNDLKTLLHCKAQVEAHVKELLSKEVTPPQTMTRVKLIATQASCNAIFSFGHIDVSTVPFSREPIPTPNLNSVSHHLQSHTPVPPTSSTTPTTSTYSTPPPSKTPTTSTYSTPTSSKTPTTSTYSTPPPSKTPTTSTYSTPTSSKTPTTSTYSTPPPSKTPTTSIYSTPPSKPLTTSTYSTPPSSKPLTTSTYSTPPPSKPLTTSIYSAPPPSKPLTTSIYSTPPPSKPLTTSIYSAPPPSKPLTTSTYSTPPSSKPLKTSTYSTPPPSKPLTTSIYSAPPPSKPLTQSQNTYAPCPPEPINHSSALGLARSSFTQSNISCATPSHIYITPVLQSTPNSGSPPVQRVNNPKQSLVLLTNTHPVRIQVSSLPPAQDLSQTSMMPAPPSKHVPIPTVPQPVRFPTIHSAAAPYPAKQKQGHAAAGPSHTLYMLPPSAVHQKPTWTNRAVLITSPLNYNQTMGTLPNQQQNPFQPPSTSQTSSPLLRHAIGTAQAEQYGHQNVAPRVQIQAQSKPDQSTPPSPNAPWTLTLSSTGTTSSYICAPVHTSSVPHNQPITATSNQPKSRPVIASLKYSKTLLQHPILTKVLMNTFSSNEDASSALTCYPPSQKCPLSAPKTVKALADSACDVSTTSSASQESADITTHTQENEPTSTMSEMGPPDDMVSSILPELLSLWDDIAPVSSDDLAEPRASESPSPEPRASAMRGDAVDTQSPSPHGAEGTASNSQAHSQKASSESVKCEAELTCCWDEVSAKSVQHLRSLAQTLETGQTKTEPHGEVCPDTQVQSPGCPSRGSSSDSATHSPQQCETLKEASPLEMEDDVTAEDANSEVPSSPEPPVRPCQLKRLVVSLFQLPITWGGPDQPLPRFRIHPGDTEEELYLETIDEDVTVDAFLEPLSSPDSPVLKQLDCAVCHSPSNNIICSQCGRGFHTNCHIPAGSLMRPDWVCSICQDLSDARDPYSSERPKTRCLSLLDQRKCEHLLLYLMCEDSSNTLPSAEDLKMIKDRLGQRCSPPYRTFSEFLSDIQILLEGSLNLEGSASTSAVMDYISQGPWGGPSTSHQNTQSPRLLTPEGSKDGVCTHLSQELVGPDPQTHPQSCPDDRWDTSIPKERVKVTATRTLRKEKLKETRKRLRQFLDMSRTPLTKKTKS